MNHPPDKGNPFAKDSGKPEDKKKGGKFLFGKSFGKKSGKSSGKRSGKRK